MVADVPLELPPYPSCSAGTSCRPHVAALPCHLDALHSKSRSQPCFFPSNLGHLRLSQQFPPAFSAALHLSEELALCWW